MLKTWYASMVVSLVFFMNMNYVDCWAPGGTWWENKLETPIDAREPRSFATTKWLVSRPEFPFQVDLVLADKTIKHLGNFERYVMDWWYETRYINSSCPILPSGLGATTDWTLNQLCFFGNITQPPKTFFVHTEMLPHFAESTLKFLPQTSDYRFILVTAGVDRTIPQNIGDVRYYKTGLRNMGAAFHTIIEDPRVLHWYAENRDIEHTKLSTMPTGFTLDLLDIVGDEYNSPDYENKALKKLPLLSRNISMLVADRTRDGWGQFADRNTVINNCRNHPMWCDSTSSVNGMGISHSEFIQKLHQHSFIACVHGGGYDPSPKAFEAIHEGTIPIMKKSIVYDAYSMYPVAWVDSWDELFHEDNRTELLNKWRIELAPYYLDGSALREKTLHKLTTSYWLELFHKKYIELINISVNKKDIHHNKQKKRLRRR